MTKSLTEQLRKALCKNIAPFQGGKIPPYAIGILSNISYNVK